MNYPEKEITVNITVTSLSSENDTSSSWTYQTPITQDCTSIYHIYHYNGTGWEDVIGTVDMHSHASENCHITVPLTTNIGQVDYYRIIMDNYMLWEIDWTWAMANVTNATLSPLCTDYALGRNYTYTVPITEDVFVNTSDNELFGCHRFFDDLYYAYYYSNLASQAKTVAELTSYYVEVVWYQNALRHNLQFATFNYAYNDFIMGMMSPSAVWNYPNRTVGIELYTTTYIGGTEYKTNETASVSVQFLRAIGDNLNPINNALCNATIYYPNSTVFISGANVSYISGSNGIYSYSFTTPATEGVYHSDFRCDKPTPSAITTYSSGTFHVAPWANTISQINSTVGNIYPFLFSMNGSLYYLLISVNDSIATKISETNQSIHQKIDSIETRIGNVNVSIYDHITETNSSILQKLYLMQKPL
jgi:hypothetical protein